ncbi:diacylglycerol/lipid kinase family protein [Brevibacterium sp. UBA7493]|uniref:diacylglycerol/lipid kinase family protein n=1 Tax=Brevibacterium sp. UBA7493 TaxID=1946121 RepID=UPI0025797AC5|nr:diacylglycerol kinase family protein [Brevibacterium sp. UBA7493]
MESSTGTLFLLALAVVILCLGLFIGYWLGSRSRTANRRAAQQSGSGRDQQLNVEDLTSADSQSGQSADIPPKPRAAIIMNPIKDVTGDFAAVASAVCRQEGWQPPLVIETTEDDPGEAMALEALDAGVDLVVAAGGDGTVRATAEVLAGTDTPMGIIPMGTGNLLARNIGLPLDRQEWAMRIALWGQDKPIDIGHAQTAPDGEDYAFLVMAGLGFDAAVMADTDSDLKSKVGWLAYFEAGARKLIGSPTRVTITVDGVQALRTKVRSVVGGNCGKLQGGIVLMPEADIADGILDLLVVAPKNAFQWIGVAASVFSRQKRKGLHTQILRGESVVIECEEKIDMQIDGDPLGETDYLAMQVERHGLIVRTPTREQTRLIRQEGWPLPVA